MLIKDPEITQSGVFNFSSGNTELSVLLQDHSIEVVNLISVHFKQRRLFPASVLEAKQDSLASLHIFFFSFLAPQSNFRLVWVAFAALILSIGPLPKWGADAGRNQNWILQAAAASRSGLFTNRLREVHRERKSNQQPKWMISSPSAGKAMQWLCDYGWTTQRMTSTKGECVFKM